MVLFSNEETLEYMEKQSDKGSEILISTFGIWAGIKKGQILSFSSIHKLLNQFQEDKKKVSILVGKPTLQYCKENCSDCESKFNQVIERIVLHSKHWKQFKWKISDGIHLKAFLVKSRNGWEGISGSRNLSGSSWEEAMIELNEPDAHLIANRINQLLK